MDKTRVAIFLGTSVTHFALQFIAWSFALGNTAVDLTQSPLSRLWPVLSFPLFRITPEAWSNATFWGIAVGNSFIWGLIGFSLIGLVRKILWKS